MVLTLVSHRLMSDSEVKAFDDMMQEAAKKHLGLDVSRRHKHRWSCYLRFLKAHHVTVEWIG